MSHFKAMNEAIECWERSHSHSESHAMTPIGCIHTPYRAKEDCPIQPAFAGQEPSRIEVYAEYAAGLKDIETFSHLILLYRFDRAGTMALVRPTFLDDTPHGIFASRHPSRPNGIGLSVVRLLRRVANALFIEGADMLDESPLLDIKPYLPRYDAIPDADPGWTADVTWRTKPKGRE